MRFPIAMLSLLLTASLAFAQESKLPDGLRHVPPDALGFIHFRAGEFLKSDLGKQLLLEVAQDREAVRGLQKIEQELGVRLGDIDSVTVLMLSVPSFPQMRDWDGPMRRDFRERDFEMKRRAEMEWQMRRMMEMEMKQKRIFEDKKFEDKKPDVKPPEPKESPVLFQHDLVPEIVGKGLELLPGTDPFEAMEYLAISGPLVIVTSTKDLDRKKILKTQLFNHGPAAGERSSPGRRRSCRG